MYFISIFSAGGDLSTFTSVSNFVSLYGSMDYVANSALPGVLTFVGTTFTSALTYTVSPPLSVLGGNLTLSSSTGVISGTTGPTTTKKTLFTVFASENTTATAGFGGFFSFYISVSPGELPASPCDLPRYHRSHHNSTPSRS